MSYCPPTNSKWAPAEPMRRKQGPDADGWQTVGPKPTSKWGESALKKAAPPPPTFEQEFPAIGNPDKEKDKKPLAGTSLADRMKMRLAEEEEVARQKAEDTLRKAAASAASDEYEKNRYKGCEFVPLASKIMSSSAAKNFETYADPEEDTSYYNEYPDHYEEDRAPQYEYDYEEPVYDDEY
jgi:hypothetical protein